MKQEGRHFFVSGKVQGVFYRANTRRKALELDLCGWVRNVPDGRVELQAFGELENLELLEKWLWEGPPAAQVENVESLVIPWQENQSFLVR